MFIQHPNICIIMLFLTTVQQQQQIYIYSYGCRLACRLILHTGRFCLILSMIAN